MRRAACALTALTLLTIPASARGDGLPVVGIDAGPTGVAAEGVRYVTMPAGAGTTVAAVAQRGGRILRSAHLRGPFTIPAVAFDGTASGLSADGRTLVLIRPRASFPQRRTHLVVLDTARLRVRARLDLRGDFSFDAISPDGGSLFFIQYRSRIDPTNYRVRAYDLAAGALSPRPVVDPREPGEQMRGLPVTRAASPDGRWAYTLYNLPGVEAFVHALDTATGSARCIDLPLLDGRVDASGLRLHVGSGLTVLDGPRPLAEVDLRSFRVTPVASALGLGPLVAGAGLTAPPPAAS
jgi:hypothetical protein